MTNPAQKLKELQSFLSDRGFIYGPSPELYGGLAGFYDYGPLGKLLKNNVENTIRNVFQRYDFFEVECPSVMPEEVWEASGHLGGFTDPVIKDKSGNSFRVDNLIEEYARKKGITIVVDGKSNEELLALIKEHNITSPSTSEAFVPEITNHNLMMKTTIGIDKVAFNRPETATTTYLPFSRYVNFFRDKLPFGVFQIGKAYRNEISPRQFLLRMREFTQAEAQLFIFKDEKNTFEKFSRVKDKKLPLWPASMQHEAYPGEMIPLATAREHNVLKNDAYAWTLAVVYDLFISAGIPKERMRFRQHHEDEMAFYADDAWDLEINMNTFGWVECCGVHDRQDYDLTTHGKHAKTDIVAATPEGKKETPHVLEIAFGTDRLTYALLDIYYELQSKDEAKTKLQLPTQMAPIPICVLPLTNKLHEQASALYEDLKQHFICLYDKSGSVGKRYLRADSIGVPFCITYDFDTLEKDKSVTVRDRDSENQERVAISELVTYLKEKL